MKAINYACFEMEEKATRSVEKNFLKNLSRLQEISSPQVLDEEN